MRQISSKICKMFCNQLKEKNFVTTIRNIKVVMEAVFNLENHSNLSNLVILLRVLILVELLYLDWSVQSRRHSVTVINDVYY